MTYEKTDVYFNIFVSNYNQWLISTFRPYINGIHVMDLKKTNKPVHLVLLPQYGGVLEPVINLSNQNKGIQQTLDKLSPSFNQG